MRDVVFSPTQFSDIPVDYDESNSRGNKEAPWFEMDETGFMDLLYTVSDQETTDEKRPNAIEANLETKRHIHEEGIQLPVSEFTKSLDEKTSSFPLASWDLPNSYGRGFRVRRAENLIDPIIGTNASERRLSTDEILRLAGERCILFSTNRADGISMFIHPYGSSLSGLSMDDARDVELVHYLLSAAEHVGAQQFDIASRLICHCLWMASDSGTPIQRVAFYFAEALQERIIRESGRAGNVKKKKKQPNKGLALGTNNTFLVTHQELPFIQMMQFAGIQAILENLKTSGKIHLIDLQIRSGIQWTALMQGLAEVSQIQQQHLKITSVGTSDQRYTTEEVGNRLLSFARSLNLSFEFKAIYLKDMSEFKEDVLNITSDETVAVYSFLMLRSMISKPHVLDNVMRAIARLKPALMVVTEVEANNNSPTFVDRFIDSLLFYSAFFDCLEDCMEKGSEYRRMLESSYSAEGITNIVATEGEERVTRNVKLDVWRAFFSRFGMVEMALSESSKYQPDLVMKQFPQGSSCTLELNGNGLVVGWKGTPFHSLTAWKFS